jgi:CheY-like chemotaxis protein
MKSIRILLVEDNEGDIVLTKEAFEESKLTNKLVVARNGKEALDFLLKKNGYENAEQPDLILLDINMPIKNGHQVLQEIKADDVLRHIPVIVLTTSSSTTDVNKAYQNHANCYIKKPVDMDEFMQAITRIEQFWFDIVSLPQVNTN